MRRGRQETSHRTDEGSEQDLNRDGNRSSAVVPSFITEESQEVHALEPGFLGSTSYAAVFIEGESHLSVDCTLNKETKSSSYDQLSDRYALTSSDVQEGAEMLALLGNLSRYQQAIDRSPHILCLSRLVPFVRECIDMVVRGDTGKLISDDTDELTISQKVFLRTATPIDLKDLPNLSQLPNHVMGDNLRWQVVGLMLTVVGLGAISLDEVPLEGIEAPCRWKDIAKQLLQVGDRYILICQEFDQS